VTSIAAFAISFSSVQLTSAEPKPEVTPSDLVTNAVPRGATSPGSPLDINDVGKASVAASQKTTLTIPDSGSADLIVTQKAATDTPALTIGLPAEAKLSADAKRSGKAALAFEGEDAQTVVQPFSDGLRLSTILRNADSPTRFTYTLPADVSPRLNADGSAILESRFGGVGPGDDSMVIRYGSVGVPWAVDAAGNRVATHYEVSGGTLAQVVEPTRISVFPIVADPTFWWGWNAFISNSVHHQVLDLIKIGAAAVSIATLFVSYIPNPYVQLAVRLAGAMAIAGVVLWNQCNANGRGVIVGQSWALAIVGARFTIDGFFCLPQ
jgi:hypothetical protein